MEKNYSLPSVVIDNGSFMIRAGFSGENIPRAVFPSLVGRPKKNNSSSDCDKELYIGNETQLNRDMLRLHYPIHYGIVTDWEEMEKIWHHTFYNELKVSPDEHPVLLTEAPLNPKVNREKMTSIMFETFSVPSMYLQDQSVLSLFTCGRTTGIALNVRDGYSYILPVYEGFKLLYVYGRRPIHDDLTEFMRTLLRNRGFSFNTYYEREIVRDIKAKLCYVALDFEAEMKKAESSSDICKSYTLPDGQIITIDKERFICPEVLFKPELAHEEFSGIDTHLNSTIQRSPSELHKTLYNNIVLTGSTITIPGLEERVYKELKSIAPSDMQIKITSPPYNYAAWTGGSLLASMNIFPEMCISKAEYDECGPSIVHRKCL